MRNPFGTEFKEQRLQSLQPAKAKVPSTYMDQIRGKDEPNSQKWPRHARQICLSKSVAGSIRGVNTLTTTTWPFGLVAPVVA